MTQQDIRFCRSRDGVRLAWSKQGSGPPLVKTAHWLGHLEHDAQSPVWQAYFEELAAHYTLVRYDQRGCGLSDRDVERHGLDAWTEDLEAIVDDAGLESFHLLAESQGGPVGVRYTAHHPARVRNLVLFGAYARGANRRGLGPDAKAEVAALHDLIRVGWGGRTAAYRELFGRLFMPDAAPETVTAFAELMRVATTPEMAHRIAHALADLDATDLARRVRAPTLVVHARGDTRVPVDEGRLLATLVPGARFVPLETDNHILQADEPAFSRLLAELHGFLGVAAERPASPRRPTSWTDDLTERETDVLHHIATGASNKEIARKLGLSPKTIRNYASIVLSKSPAGRRSELIVRAREAGFGTTKADPDRVPGRDRDILP